MEQCGPCGPESGPGLILQQCDQWSGCGIQACDNGPDIYKRSTSVTSFIIRSLMLEKLSLEPVLLYLDIYLLEQHVRLLKIRTSEFQSLQASTLPSSVSH